MMRHVRSPAYVSWNKVSVALSESTSSEWLLAGVSVKLWRMLPFAVRVADVLDTPDFS